MELHGGRGAHRVHQRPLLRNDFQGELREDAWMGVLVQAGANLINSYCDFKSGVDSGEQCADRAILDGHVSPKQAMICGFLCLLGAGKLVAPFLSNPEFRQMFIAGSALAVAYSVPPVSLKYRAMGDLAILTTFGPLLMQSTAVAMTGRSDHSITLYSIPIGMLTEAILWANNTRDIDNDKSVKIRTVCNMLGFTKSKDGYRALVYGAYAVCAVLAAKERNSGLLLPLLTLPLAKSTLEAFQEGRESLREADSRTAQLHLPFGVLLILGVLLGQRMKA
eukprot:CAMPEP_0204347332 /NCGR_PEP_ID=MMETSP0469-20131031/27857_1 /ASSEMBLY_ACC=CAM_ASM_000384 /TAXON_ID=2969 /ORGANISM="Oxyrrhis marina" /LENGTH=277 /DNA_ID=CAMNT_0051333123 /DNA_START=44 /DNA_END=878 /DNA_ORIENTATION=+